MRRFLTVAIGSAVITATAFCAPAMAVTGKAKGDTINYTYKKTTGPDSSTCGGNWANDTMNRTFEIYPDQANNGSYFVTEVFNGKFATIAGSSPESCEAATSNTVAANVQGKWRGYETLYISNASVSGTWNAATNVACSANCTTADFVAGAFGAGATYTVGDWWFKYTTTDATACAKQWVNANYGNSGDIATTCAP